MAGHKKSKSYLFAIIDFLCSQPVLSRPFAHIAIQVLKFIRLHIDAKIVSTEVSFALL